MAAKVEWQSFDYATHTVLAQIIDDSGLAYRAIANRMGNFISHVRIGDIHNGKKGAAKVSELLAICEACNADPVEAIRSICDLAKTIEAEHDKDAEKAAIAEMLQQASDPVKYGLAALHDPNKEIEALGDAGPDWDDPA